VRKRFDVAVFDATSTPTHTSDFRQGTVGNGVGGGIVALAYDGAGRIVFYWSESATYPSPSCTSGSPVGDVAIGRLR
jgi:hypothetical protein